MYIYMYIYTYIYIYIYIYIHLRDATSSAFITMTMIEHIRRETSKVIYIYKLQKGFSTCRLASLAECTAWHSNIGHLPRRALSN